MLKLDTGSCETRVLSMLFLSGRMGDWGRLDAVGHLFLGSPPRSCSLILLCSSGRYWLISWPLPRARLHLEPGDGVWKLLRVSQRWRQLSGGPLLDSIFVLFLSPGRREGFSPRKRFPRRGSRAQSRFRAWALRRGAGMGADLSGW